MTSVQLRARAEQEAMGTVFSLYGNVCFKDIMEKEWFRVYRDVSLWEPFEIYDGDTEGLRELLRSFADQFERYGKEILKGVDLEISGGQTHAIMGPNGTGKELIARAIHRNSARKNESFVSVDLGSITETLFESEL